MDACVHVEVGVVRQVEPVFLIPSPYYVRISDDGAKGVNEEWLSRVIFKNSTPSFPRSAPAVDDRVSNLTKYIEENGKEFLGENEIVLYCSELDPLQGVPLTR